jgi:hypothetical protein
MNGRKEAQKAQMRCYFAFLRLFAATLAFRYA